MQDDRGRWYLARVLPYRSTEDRIEGVVITFIDIDSRKKAEEAVRASEQRLRRMMNVDGVGVLIFDQSGTLIDCNDAYLKISGFSKRGRCGPQADLAVPDASRICRGHRAAAEETGRDRAHRVL